MESDNKTSNGISPAPMARMSRIAPSLESLTSKPNLTTNCIVPVDNTDKISQVKFKRNSSESSSSSSSSSESDDGNPNIPDGGWGWVVVFATFILCMVADGVTFSFGLLYVAFLEEFEASNSATSWIGSLFMAVPLITGPVMSALVDKFGCRSMTIVGGVISATGFILSSKCHSLSLMYLTFGTLAGLGLGLIYVTVVVSVAFWFDKKRTLAVGIGSSGIGIGTFVFSPLSTYLISEFGWRGTTLILGGCFLNMCVCGALMRDPDWIIAQNRQNSKSKLSKSARSSKASLAISNGDHQSDVINIEELKALLTRETDAKTLLQNLETSLENNEEKDKLKDYFHSTVNLPTFISKHEKVPVEVLELLRNNKNVYNVILTQYPSLLVNKYKSDEHNLHKNNDYGRSLSIQQDSFPKRQTQQKQPLMARKNSYHEKYFKNLKVDKHSLVHKGALFNTNKYRFKASSCPNIYRVSMVSLPKLREEKWYSEIVDLVKDMFDYSLFLELHFCLLSLSTITLFTWFIVPYFYLADLMVKTGYSSEQASFTISNIGISNTVGMLFLGWAGDRPWMNITKTYAICLVFCGLSIAGQMFFVQNFIMLQLCASLFGISLSSHFAFTPGIVMELVPLDRFTIAYGLQLLCQGIGTLVGPPYAGLLYDITKSWEQSFYQAGIWIVLSGLFVWIIPYIRNRKMIGKGPVEKEAEDSENRVLPLVILSISMVLSFGLMFYLTGKGMHRFFESASS